MTDADKIEALLDLVDDSRTADPKASDALVVLGLATRQGKGYAPTNAGWHLMGDRGRAFDATYRRASRD